MGARIRNSIDYLYARYAPKGANDIDNPYYWQERALFVLVVSGVFLSPIVLIPSFVLIMSQERYLLLGTDLATYATALFLFFYHDLPYRLRAAWVSLAMYAIGAALLWSFGPYLGVKAWLFAFAVIAGVLLGRVGALAAVGLNMITLIGVGVLLKGGLWGDNLISDDSIWYWSVVTVNFLLLNLFTALMITELVAGINISHQKYKATAHHLELERQELVEAKNTLEQEIEERKKAEATILSVRERQRRILNSIAAGVFLIEPQNHVIEYANSAALSMIGFSTDEVVGSVCHNFICPDEAGNCPITDQRLEKDCSERILVTRTGEVLPVLKTVVPIFLEDKKYLLETFLDISDRKLLEKQLAQAQKLEAVGTLASGIAHDFNNILQAISGYVQLMTHIDGLDPRVQKYSTEVDEASQRARDLIQQLLTFSRKVEPELKALDIEEEVMHAVRMLERTIPRMIQIETYFPDDLKPIRADVNQLNQVLMNLGANARDAMPEGGRLTLAAQNVIIDSQNRPDRDVITNGEYVLLEVADTGCGMDQETLKHIFDPFYTTKKIGDGTGLGLSTVYGIVKGHGGHISCESSPLIGTVFRLHFPVAALDDKFMIDSQPTVDLDIGRGEETILLVDDEETVIEVARESLLQYGYQVVTARSGEDALNIYRKNMSLIRLVILDLGMPGMGGQNCLKELLRLNPALKIIIASGYSETEHSAAAIQAGAKGFIKKPYRLTHMLHQVRDILDQ